MSQILFFKLFDFPEWKKNQYSGWWKKWRECQIPAWIELSDSPKLYWKQFKKKNLITLLCQEKNEYLTKFVFKFVCNTQNEYYKILDIAEIFFLRTAKKNINQSLQYNFFKTSKNEIIDSIWRTFSKKKKKVMPIPHKSNPDRQSTLSYWELWQYVKFNYENFCNSNLILKFYCTYWCMRYATDTLIDSVQVVDEIFQPKKNCCRVDGCRNLIFFRIRSCDEN